MRKVLDVLQNGLVETDNAVSRRRFIRYAVRVSATLAAIAAGIAPRIEAFASCGYINCCYTCNNYCRGGCPCTQSYSWPCYQYPNYFTCIECDSCNCFYYINEGCCLPERTVAGTPSHKVA
jgi:hypothetical protein